MLDLHILMIGFHVCDVVHEKPDLPDPCRLIDHTTDDDRREGIRRYFTEDPAEPITEEEVELVLAAYHEWERQQDMIRDIGDFVVRRGSAGRW